MIDDHLARRVERVTFDHHGLLLAAHVGNDHRHQQLAHQRPRVLEVIHHVCQRHLGLLKLGLLLDARRGRALLAHECRAHAADALHGAPAVVHQLELLLVQLKVALDLEARARLRHMARVQHNVGVGAGDHAAELGVRHVHGALGALGAHGGHAPAQLGDAPVQVVLREDHVPHQPVGHAGQILAVAEHGHVGEIPVRVRRRAVVQHVRPHPVGAAHLGQQLNLQLGSAGLHRGCVRHVGRVEFHHAAGAQLEHHGFHPAAIPDLGHADGVVLVVEPSVLLHRPGALTLDGRHQAGAVSTLQHIAGKVGHPLLGAVDDDLLVLREKLRHALTLDPPAAKQPARIAQIGLTRLHVPPDFVAMNRSAGIGVLAAVGRARDLHPSDTHRHLWPEPLGQRPVGAAVALGLVQLVVQHVGHVLAGWIAIGRHAPVRARLGLIAAHRSDGRADDVLLGRRDAQLGLLAQQVG